MSLLVGIGSNEEVLVRRGGVAAGKLDKPSEVWMSDEDILGELLHKASRKGNWYII